MNKGEYKVGKNKPVFDDNLQYGKQLPDGELEWHGETVAYKLGWTTAGGRLQAQARYDDELRNLGVRLSDETYLRWYTRRREFTEPEEIQDIIPEPEVPDITTDPGFPQPVANDGPTEVGTALDVSGTESREPGDPTHLIVDDQGLLVGTVSSTEPAVVTGGQAIVAVNEEPATEQLQPATLATIPDWAQAAVTPAVLQEGETVVKSVDVPTPPTAATPF